MAHGKKLVVDRRKKPHIYTQLALYLTTLLVTSPFTYPRFAFFSGAAAATQLE